MNKTEIKHPIVLIYKRTHKGDPDENGIFGIHDCMGKVRNRNYTAVIGIGGKRPWRDNENIAYKVNWIGRDPTKIICRKNNKKPCVAFERFCLFDELGPKIKDIAPMLYEYMYNGKRRIVMSTSLPDDVYNEVLKILSLADNCQPSHKLEFECASKREDEADFK